MNPEIDMTQFHDIFFEESMEGIEIMESELLKLNEDSDPEVINTIFRAAHSIKGGGATFGFNEIADFTHGMETILDEMRNERLLVTRKIIDLLLASVDCLQEMIKSSKAKKEYDQKAVAELIDQHNVVVNDCSEAKVNKAVEEASVLIDEAPHSRWNINFAPHEHLLFTGNDPLRIVRELKSLGDLSIDANLEKLPDFYDIEPQNCYLGWQMHLRGKVTEQQLEEVFAWVEDICELTISQVENKPVEEKAVSLDGRNGERRDTLHRRKTDKQASLLDRRQSDVSTSEASSIRVGIAKVDALVNLVGELVITQSILSRACNELALDELEKLNDSLVQLERNTRDLQEQTMSIRMLPIDFAFQRLPRLVHDLSLSLNKKVELTITGETTELDKTVLEKIGDPLVHLVRNAIDHGIETPEERVAAGKPETGMISVNALHQGGNIIIQISDDGAGLNPERIRKKAIQRDLIEEDAELTETQLQKLIFHPGFSTAEIVSDVSGRGVGMDVVKKNIAGLGGSVDVSSRQGKGATFTIRLPLTLAILDGQMVRAGNQIYIVPLLSIVESIQIQQEHLSEIAGEAELYQYRDEYIPVIQLQKVFSVHNNAVAENALSKGSKDILVIVEVDNERIGLQVDEVVGQQQIVIKSLKQNYKQVQGLMGATVLGDGLVALILDVYSLRQIQVSSALLQQQSDFPGSDLSQEKT